LSSAVIGLALIFITAVLLFRNNRQKQKANKLLKKQKQEIDQKAKDLEQSYNNVEMLGDIGRKVTSSLSVETIISTVYDSVNSMMDAAVFGIGIYHEDTKQIDFPATYENGVALPAYSNSVYEENRFASLCFISGKEIVMGDVETEHKNYLQHIPAPKQGQHAASLIYIPLKAKERMFGVITVQSFQKNAYSDYHLYMLRTIALYAAIALENAESYKKLNHTVDSLTRTQSQLIQAEKMASLGELTAGIAHEIQNPLNFVNNFAEVNVELIEELGDLMETGDMQAVNETFEDIKRNLEKIRVHGRRADSIVKGMLQHSQSSTGVKETIDINALTDEYLRLAYHGLRAKDKSFNAITKTEFDHRIDKISVVPQEIGRVLLNLINNAYYTVNEKKKVIQNGYEPTVTVSTVKDNGQVKIKVRDNGNGIPPKILDKIFQPFFTTKPTGQGTGLGLSLAYDIVKAHGGEIKVETRENEGTEFTMVLAA
jgi:signal transduction histidine kinase